MSFVTELAKRRKNKEHDERLRLEAKAKADRKKDRLVNKRYLAHFAMFYVGSDGVYYGRTTSGCSRDCVLVYARQKKNRKWEQIEANTWPKCVTTDEGNKVTLIGNFIVRVSRKSCPFKVNYGLRKEMGSGRIPYDKHLFNNLPFYICSDSDKLKEQFEKIKSRFPNLNENE